MDIYYNVEDCEADAGGIVTVGSFDGIHNAHRAIITRIIEQASTIQATSTVVTFEPHPRFILRKENSDPVWILSTLEEKIEVIEKLGPDRLIVIPFTKEFSQIPAKRFVTDILCEKIGLRKLVVGYDHGFGKNRTGDSEVLQEIARISKFELEIVQPVSNQYGTISSTGIREYIHNGEVSKASECMGASYRLKGEVVHGDGRGKELDFPTANIQIDNPNKCLPLTGVYIVQVRIDGVYFNGVMNIGVRPTFDREELSLEVHILDFVNEIYNKSVDIYFLERIRGEHKFGSANELKAQIESDVEYTRNYFHKNVTTGTAI